MSINKNSRKTSWVNSLKQLMTLAMTLLMLFFSNVSREWLHQFAGHIDTVHTHADDVKKGTVIESQHHHCKFLDIPLPVFLELENYYIVNATPDYCSEIFVWNSNTFFDNCLAAFHTRGPPGNSFLKLFYV